MSSKLEVIKHTIVLKEPKVEMIRSILVRQKKQSIRRKVTSTPHGVPDPTLGQVTCRPQASASPAATVGSYYHATGWPWRVNEINYLRGCDNLSHTVSPRRLPWRQRSQRNSQPAGQVSLGTWLCPVPAVLPQASELTSLNPFPHLQNGEIKLTSIGCCGD